MSDHASRLLESFERGTIDPAEFAHRHHVAVAYEMLDRYDFAEACARYANAIKALATRAGAPEKYNATITLAYLSLIAERMAQSAHRDAESFLAANPDLMDKYFLNRWYSEARLSSPLARRQFLLPDNVSRRA